MIKFLSILQIVFITLKLTGHIDWGWFCVMLPFISIPVIIITVFVVVAIGTAYFDKTNY